jgi:hypothetical protein
MCIQSFALFFQQGKYLCIANSLVLVLSILLDYIYSLLIECHRMPVETQELGLVNCLEVTGDVAFLPTLTFSLSSHRNMPILRLCNLGVKELKAGFAFTKDLFLIHLTCSTYLFLSGSMTCSTSGCYILDCRGGV